MNCAFTSALRRPLLPTFSPINFPKNNAAFTSALRRPLLPTFSPINFPKNNAAFTSALRRPLLPTFSPINFPKNNAAFTSALRRPLLLPFSPINFPKNYAAFTSALSLPTVSSIFRGRVHAPIPANQSINCLFGRTFDSLIDGDAQAEKSSARVYKSEWPGRYKPRKADGMSCVTNVCETKLTLDYENSSETEKVSHILVGRPDCFSAVSVDEDGNLSPKYDLYPPSPYCEFDFSNSFGGLFSYFQPDSRIFLWNPTANEYKILPQCQSFVGTPLHAHQMMSSDIWFDHQSQDLKVMRAFVLYFEDEDGNYIGSESRAELYSLKTNSWKTIPFPEDVSVDESRRACIDGIYYCDADEGSFSFILSFDFAAETFSTIPYPDDKDQFQCLSFQDYNGLLSILIYSTAVSSQIDKSFELWVMRNGSWTRESVFHTCGVRNPVSFCQNGKLLFFVSLNDELVVFNRSTGKLKHLGAYDSMCTEIIPFHEMQSFVGAPDVEEKEEEGGMIDAEDGLLVPLA